MSSFTLTVLRNGNQVTVVSMGSFVGALTFAYYAEGVWTPVSTVNAVTANSFEFVIPDTATRIRGTDSAGEEAYADILQEELPDPPSASKFTIRAERNGTDVRIFVTGTPDGALEFRFKEGDTWVTRYGALQSSNTYYFSAPAGWAPEEVLATDAAGNVASANIPAAEEPAEEPEEPKPTVPYFEDRNIGADTEDTPPNPKNPFNAPGEYPSVVFLHQQRLGYASSRNRPLTVWLSQSGNFESMAASLPPADDDAIEATLAATQANRILWCQSDRNGLAIGTEGGEWVLAGAEDGALTPSNLSFQPQTFHGSEPGLPVLRAGAGLLYMQRGGRVAREYGYNFSADRYESGDLSLLARHILRSNAVRAWAWQDEPYGIVWCALDNGTLAGLTYMREHDVVAWHRHSTPDGFVEHVTCIPGDDGMYQLWLVVRRNKKRRIERMNPFEAASPFDREATLRAKVIQMNATAAEGRADWTREEIEALIFSRGFASVEQWWTAYGRDEGVCPWNDGAACREAGYLYTAALDGGEMTLDAAAYLDGAEQQAFQARCIPCFPDSTLQNGTTFLRVRKINALKCRVMQAKPFLARVGQGSPLPVPVRGAGYAELADWAVPLGAGWSDNERLELIFDGPDPVTVLGLVVTMELADLAGSQK